MAENKFPKGLKDPTDRSDVRSRPGEDSLPTRDASAEINEKDYKEGQRRKGGQRVE